MTVGLALVKTDSPRKRGKVVPVQLVNAQLVELFWPQVRPLFDRCVREAMRGELTVDDIKEQALAGQIVIMVFTDSPSGNGTVDLAVAIEPVAYPKMPGINILALGGTNFGLIQQSYWTYFKGWALMNGARMIEASVSYSMLRMLQRYGFVEEYVHVRCHLAEK